MCEVRYTMTGDSYFVMDKLADNVAVFSGGSGRALRYLFEELSYSPAINIRCEAHMDIPLLFLAERRTLEASLSTPGSITC
jgi:hypothetical protein